MRPVAPMLSRVALLSVAFYMALPRYAASSCRFLLHQCRFLLQQCRHFALGLLWFLSFLGLLVSQAQSQPPQSQQPQSQPQVIRTLPLTADIDKYALTMLQLALSHVPQAYDVQVDKSESRTQGRYVQDVLNGQVDVMWAASDRELEERLLPVRIPLMKGLLGHRLLLIRQGDQAKFDRVKNLEDLRRLITLGQGSTWADTKILEANGLQVVKTNKYISFFHMLDGGRFDAFPRGIQEPWGEVAMVPGLKLAVEEQLMLVYKMPYYFFVNPANTQLAKAIELGLNRAIADGSFDRTFYADPAIRAALEKANVSQRRVFYLDNPELPPQTPIDREELWLDVTNLPPQALSLPAQALPPQ